MASSSGARPDEPAIRVRRSADAGWSVTRSFDVGWLCASVLALAAAAALAHVGGSTGYASITVSQSTVRYRLTLPTSTLRSAMAEQLLLAQLGDKPNKEKLLDVIRQNIVLRAGHTTCEPGPGVVEPSAFDATSVTMMVDFACGAPVRDLAIRDNIFDVLGRDHHTLAKIEMPGRTEQFAFEPDAREAQVRVAAEEAGPRWSGSFFLLGVHHILSGWDHLLFLLGLLLPCGGLLSLFKIVTAFTLAHSVTLALAVLDLVHLPDRLVESVIALSIAFIAAENLFPRATIARRWVVSFAFGLVHGFGFSSALRELGLPSQGLALSLLGFNLGVEAGQTMVVALVLPLLLLLQRTSWEPRMVSASSLAILIVGLVLFVERLLL